MNKTAVMQARIEPEVKKEAEAMLKQFGIGTSDFINMAVNQMLLEKRIPFSSRIPNQETIDAINEDVSDRVRYANVEEAMDALWPKDMKRDIV